MIFFDNQTNNTSCVAGMKGPTVVYTPDGVTRALFEVKCPWSWMLIIQPMLQEGLSAFPAPGKVVGPTSSRWWDRWLISSNLSSSRFWLFCCKSKYSNLEIGGYWTAFVLLIYFASTDEKSANCDTSFPWASSKRENEMCNKIDSWRIGWNKYKLCFQTDSAMQLCLPLIKTETGDSPVFVLQSPEWRVSSGWIVYNSFSQTCWTTPSWSTLTVLVNNNNLCADVPSRSRWHPCLSSRRRIRGPSSPTSRTTLSQCHRPDTDLWRVRALLHLGGRGPEEEQVAADVWWSDTVWRRPPATSRFEKSHVVGFSGLMIRKPTPFTTRWPCSSTTLPCLRWWWGPWWQRSTSAS